MKYYRMIQKLVKKFEYKLALGDYKDDFIQEMWLMLQEMGDKEKITEGYVYRIMLHQRFNKHNPIYKKLFKFGDLTNELDEDIKDED